MIRSLYYIYPPFVDRYASSLRRCHDPHLAEGAVLLGHWQSKVASSSRGTKYMCCFHLKQRTAATQPLWLKYAQRYQATTKKPRQLVEDFAMLDDDDYGDECEEDEGASHLSNFWENCMVLKLSCNWPPPPLPPSALGSKLLTAQLQLGVEQSLRLRFVPPHQRTHDCDGAVDVEMTGFRAVHVFPWHHPLYAKLCGKKARRT